MCRPREPDVFGTAGTFSESSSSRTHRATSMTVEKGVPSPGSRSIAT